MSASADCNICLDKAKKPIQCPKCQEKSCSKCIQTYMLNEITEPHCPNCNYGWTRRFIHENLPASFLTGSWAAHRRTVLWTRNLAHMSEAQVYAERVKQSRVLEKDREPLLQRRQILLDELEIVDNMISELNRNIYRLAAGQAVTEIKEEPRKFTRKCMQSDCNGFLSTAWKCGLCENYTCRDCLTVKGENHTCSEADLATASLIAKDTKPCPKCGEGINRSEGCNNMFCTACKTAFNWNTMRIQEGGYIDNPHYFAYAQTIGLGARNPGELPCGGLPSTRGIDALVNWKGATQLGSYGRHSPPEHRQAEEIHRFLGHMFGNIAQRYNGHNEDGDNNMIRVKFLLNEITKDEAQRLLLNTERRNERHRAIREVIDTFVTVCSDLFRNYEARATEAILAQFPDYNPELNNFRKWWLENKKTTPVTHEIWCAEWKKIYEEIDKLRIYCNTAFADVSKYYACVAPHIDDTFVLLSRRFGRLHMSDTTA